MESIQYAYQGFAKQQYMLLDNLKLGYGGTKTEMERLLADAEAITGVKYDISNLSDVYEAIHVIQTELGITGTTALEAEKTITGSLNSTKAAWQDLVTAIGRGDGLNKAIENFVDSVSNLFENIVPVVEKSLRGIGRVIERIAPQLVQKVAKLLIESIPSLLNAVYEMIIGLAKGIYQGIMTLFQNAMTENTKKQADAIEGTTSNQKELTEAIKETNKELKGSLAGFDELNTLTTREETSLNLGEIGTTTSSKVQLDVEVETEIKEPSNFSSILKKIADKVKTIFKPVTDSLANLFEPLKENLFFVWDDLKIFKDWIIDELTPAFAESLASGIDLTTVTLGTLSDNFLDFKEIGDEIISDIGEWIINIVDFFAESFEYLGQKLVEYEEEIDLFLEFLGGVIKIIWAILKPIFEMVGTLVSTSFKDVTDGVFSIISVIANLYNFVKNIILGTTSLFKGNFDEAGNYFKEGLKSFVNFFIGIANLIISVINELWTLIFNIFKTGVNVIGGIVAEVASWFGAEWDLYWDAEAPRIPEIPYLAQGAVIPGGREFLAVVGDQPKGQTNIEAPLDTIKQALAEVMRDYDGGGNQPIIVEIDGKEVFRAVKNAEMRYGSQIMVGGAY